MCERSTEALNVRAGLLSGGVFALDLDYGRFKTERVPVSDDIDTAVRGVGRYPRFVSHRPEQISSEVLEFFVREVQQQRLGCCQRGTAL